MTTFRTRAAVTALLAAATLSAAACNGTGSDGAASSSTGTPGSAGSTTTRGSGTAAPASSTATTPRPPFVTAGRADCTKLPDDLLAGAGFGPGSESINGCSTTDTASRDPIFIEIAQVGEDEGYWTSYAGATDTIPGMPAWRLYNNPGHNTCTAMYKTPADNGLVVLYASAPEPAATPVCSRLPDLARALAPALP